MKPSFFHLPAILLLLVIASAFTATPVARPSLHITIQGVEGRDLLKDGIARTEFAPLTIDTDQEGAVVKKFDIVLARGSKPIETVEVATGNRVDLREFADSARPGARLVVDVKEITGIELTDVEHSVVVIPVKQAHY